MSTHVFGQSTTLLGFLLEELQLAGPATGGWLGTEHKDFHDREVRF